MAPLVELVLFAGAGGCLAATAAGRRVICAVEKDPFAREIILRRQEDGSLDEFPVFSDVDDFHGVARHLQGRVDVVTAGFPCQGWSKAGRRRGETDPRNKWPVTAEIIGAVRPDRSVHLENVPQIRPYLSTITGDLQSLGYDSIWGILSARSAGGPHLRKRWFLVAYPNRSACSSG